MKKTLVALAVLAASGASFAQVTLTGDLEWGYAQSHAGSNGGDAGGFGVDTSELYFDAVEDLGGGLKVSAHMGLIGADRTAESAGNQNVRGEDAKLTFTGGFGGLTLGTVRNGAYSNSVIGVAAAPGFDGKVDGARSYRDVIIYNTPELIPGLTGQVYLSEPNFQSNPAADTGLGAGSLGYSGQRKDILSLNYGAGPIKANIGFVSQDNRVDGPASTSGTTGYRLGGTYDAGVVLVGLGYDRESLVNGTDTETMVNINVPFGAFSVGANWISRQFSGVTSSAVEGTKTGYGLGARYQLSKSTAVWAQYAAWDNVVNTNDRSTGFEIAVAKSF
jgi:hypothetical protein